VTFSISSVDMSPPRGWFLSSSRQRSGSPSSALPRRRKVISAFWRLDPAGTDPDNPYPTVDAAAADCPGKCDRRSVSGRSRDMAIVNAFGRHADHIHDHAGAFRKDPSRAKLADLSTRKPTSKPPHDSLPQIQRTLDDDGDQVNVAACPTTPNSM